MPFHTKLRVEALRGMKYRRLLRTLVYSTPDDHFEIAVPRGFITDYASIPNAVRWFIDQDAPMIRDISVVHDYLYSTDCPVFISRKDADRILFWGIVEALCFNGGYSIPKGAWNKLKFVWGATKALLAYVAVRIAGASHYQVC